MILWLDLETTGLDPTEDAILEVAAIMTDDKLVEVDRLQCVTTGARNADYTQLRPVVQDMHHANGLWMESLRSTTSLDRARDILHEFVMRHCPDAGATDENKTGPQLAGSTISFDRAFLAVDMPSVVKLLHYRMIDVSTLNEIARRFWPGVYADRPRGTTAPRHRAMDDVEMSLLTARYYAGALTGAHEAESLIEEAGALTSALEDIAGTDSRARAALDLAPGLRALAGTR